MLRLATLGALLLLALPADAGEGLRIDDFENGISPRWEVKAFQGRTDYQVVAEGAGRVLRAASSNTASGLIFPIDYDLRDYPLLKWRWKISGVLAKGDANRKAGDDYAARVYVIFPHWFPPKTRSINYIWANRLPLGEVVPNAFYANAVLVAAQSGPARAGNWVEETHDVLADYRRIFGEEPPRAGAIALMTDTDQTGESVTAWYDDLRVEAR